MNGIVPGPLWLAIASAATSDSLENGTLTHHSKNDIVAGKRANRDNEPMNRRVKTGADVDATTASREASERHRISMLEGGTGEENEERHGVS
jgi:hypothetical protein